MLTTAVTRAACASPISQVTCPRSSVSGAEPSLGVVDWLAAGPEAPTDALDRLLFEVAPGIASPPPWSERDLPAAATTVGEAGAALAVTLRESPIPTLVDCGTASEPASRAVVEVADVSVVVLRGCYLALRRAVHGSALASTTAAVLLEEPGRSLSANDVSEVLDLPVLARVPVQAPDRTGRRRRRAGDPIARAARPRRQRPPPSPRSPWGPERRRRVTLVADPGAVADDHRELKQRVHRRLVVRRSGPARVASRRRGSRPADGAAPRRAAAALERAIRRAARRARRTRSPASARSNPSSPIRPSPR